jgi:hypothetical protein
MQSTKTVFISIVLALLVAPIVYYSAVLKHETRTKWDLSEIGLQLRELGEKVNHQVCRQDEATKRFIRQTKHDLCDVNEYLERLARFRVRCRDGQCDGEDDSPRPKTN